ncbi:MAG: glycosyltransferase family 2 protein [Methylomonas sp.]
MALRFSIITCTWNSEPYLRQSIESVLAQDYTEIEQVFVDGGSTDGTLERIRSLPGNVKCVSGITGGISRAMNVGIEMASGDVIAHLHSDDYYAHPQVLSHVAKAMQETGAEWLFGRCLSDIDGRLVPEGHAIPQYSYRRLLKGNFIPHPATFIRKALFERTAVFDTAIRYAMDYDMWLRLGKLAEPVQLDEHLAVFRRHAGSLSTSNLLAAFEDDFAVRMKHADKNPYSRAYHWGHYLVRRSRLNRRIAAAGQGDKQ